MRLTLKDKVRGSSGFTLVELLVVIAIITIMIAISGPAINAITNSGGVNRAVNGVSLVLEQARAYAMSHNTYVWVGLYQDPVTQKLTVAAVAGTAGTQDDLTNIKFSPISRLQTYDNFLLTTSENLGQINGVNEPADDINKSDTSFQLPQPKGGFIKFTHAVQFSPQGEATLASTLSLGAASHWIQIILQPIRGGNPNRPDPNLSVIQVAALTGQVEVFRR